MSSLFKNCLGFQETLMEVESDRQVKFLSKPLTLIRNEKWSLEQGRLPDLRYQDININTEMQGRVTQFLNGKDYLGLLIGPTGCGKSHEMINRAKAEFTIFLDAQAYLGTTETNDLSLSNLKQKFEIITQTWTERNQDLAKLRTIAYAFVLTRMLFLKYLKEKSPGLTPKQFLIHQLFNSLAIDNCFNELKELSLDQLRSIRYKFVDFQCLFCVDEAHVLMAHLGDLIITSTKGNHIQQNGDVNENAKRGTLSVLLFAIKDCQFAKKVLFAGTSSKLRNIDNFGTFETKPIAPIILNQFAAWDKEMALNYVSCYVDIPRPILSIVLTDNYRPRILENFVYDLFSVGMNDNGSPQLKDRRIVTVKSLFDLAAIVQESYGAVIHRFTRVSIEPHAKSIRDHAQVEMMLKLLLSSMMTRNGESINCQLNDNQKAFFLDTIGSIYLISSFEGYSFFEGYVIDSFLLSFENELDAYQLASSVNLLKKIIHAEGKKTTAKGTPFEAVVLADIINSKFPSIAQVLSNFDIVTDYNLQNLDFPKKEAQLDDETIILQRPENVFFRPSNQFRPDILAFLSKEVCISFGIKIYTSRIPLLVHEDNVTSTDPDLFFSKSERFTHKNRRDQWIKSITEIPFKFSARFLIELPEPVATVSTKAIHHIENGKESVIVAITKHNMRQFLSQEVCLLVDFITK